MYTAAPAAVLPFPTALARPRVDAVRRAVRERAEALSAKPAAADHAVAIALRALRAEGRSAALAVHLGCRALRRSEARAPHELSAS